MQKQIPYAQEKLNFLLSKNLIDHSPEYFELIKNVADIEVAKDEVVAHGDLKSAHILFHNGETSGVIDWGDIHIGHRATDLAGAFTMLPPEDQEISKQHYGPISEADWKLAQLRALFHTCAILEYAHETAQVPMFSDAKTALNWTFG